MKRLFATALTILLLSNTTFAISFQAHIVQRGTNQPATQAVIVFSVNGVGKARNITGDDGLCFVDLPEGTYSVKISYRGKTREYPNFTVPSAKYEFDI
jgi:hypothetical protein